MDKRGIVVVLVCTGIMLCAGSCSTTRTGVIRGKYDSEVMQSRRQMIEGRAYLTGFATTPEAYEDISTFDLVTAQGDTLSFEYASSTPVKCMPGSEHPRGIIPLPGNGLWVRLYTKPDRSGIDSMEVDCGGNR